MAHNIHINEKGEASAAFATGKNGLPWHNLGQMVEDAMTWQDAMVLAHLDWTVEKAPLFMKNPVWTPESETRRDVMASGNVPQPKGFKVPNQFGIIRSDLAGKPESVLGIVGNSYEPTQNIEIGGWVDKIMEQIDGAHYEAAGVLGRGEKVWALARVPFNASVGADEHQTYLLFLNAHDGSMANTIMLTDVRVVCQNTLNMAMSYGTKDAMFKVRHTANAKDRLNTITENIQTGLKQDVEGLKLKFEKLITRKVTQQSFADTMTKLFGEKWEQSDSKSEKVLEIAKLFKDNDNNAIPEQADSGMALVNAVTNYVDHQRPSRVTSTSGYTTQLQARADSAWIGTGATMKTTALETVLEVVELPENTSNPNPAIQVNNAEKSKSIDNIMDLVG